MKKVKKNNKPLIILVVGLLIAGCLFGFSFYKMNQHREFLVEDKKAFDKKIADEKKTNEEVIAAANKKIEQLEDEIDAIDVEITALQRQKTQVFHEDRGWSSRYYALEDQITAKRKIQGEKTKEIVTHKSSITKSENIIWKIDNEWDDYRYKKPGYKKGNPYWSLGLGILVTIVTLWAAGISHLFKVASNDKSYSEFNEIDEGDLSSIDVNDGKLLKKELFEKLESLLLASSKENYDVIRKLCTKNMAKSYIDEVELLKKHKEKLFIKEIENKGCKIIKVYKSNHNTKIMVVQKIKLYNYTKNVTTNEIVTGDDKNKAEQAFKLVFVKDFVPGHNVKKCPNCGANIKDATKVACDYCGTVFDNSNYDWYLESKVIISED